MVISAYIIVIIMFQIQIMSVGGVQLNTVYTISGDEVWESILFLDQKTHQWEWFWYILIQVDGYFGYDFAVLDANAQG